eukprot:7004090-Pyramimonas_sp.AAC.1
MKPDLPTEREALGVVKNDATNEHLAARARASAAPTIPPNGMPRRDRGPNSSGRQPTAGRARSAVFTSPTSA